MVAAAAYVAVRALATVRVVLVPVGAALLLGTVLIPVERALVARRWPALVATWVTFVGFLALFVAVVAAIGPAVVGEFDDLDVTLEQAVDDVEDWLVDGPLSLDADTVTEWRRDLEDQAEDILASEDSVTGGAILVGQTVTGIVLTLAITFFVVKDGRAIQRWFVENLPAAHQERARAMGQAAWRTLGAFLRAAAILGAVEGAILGITLAVVGADLALPLAVVTFLAAFVPFVGAVVAGVLAVLVTLVSAGVPQAAIVAAVALVVQQFDNELLAPWVYGRVLRIHPLVVILSVATGATVGGLTGAFLAVPVSAVVISAWGAARHVATAAEE